MLQEFVLDPTYNRFGLLATAPFLVCVSLVSGPFRATFPLLISISFSVCKSLPTSRIGELGSGIAPRKYAYLLSTALDRLLSSTRTRPITLR